MSVDDPHGRENWLRIARRWHEQGMAPPENPSPLFGALYDAIAITDEMVERGASALAIANGYNPNSEDPSYWPRTTARYREAAETVLVAALHWKHRVPLTAEEGES